MQPSNVLAVQLAQPVTHWFARHVSTSLQIAQSALQTTQLPSLFKKKPSMNIN